MSHRAAACLVLLSALLSVPVARAGDDDLKRACIDAHAETQRRRQRGELATAREAAVKCAQPACPDLVRGECLRWLPELEEGIPTVVVEVQDDVGGALDGRLTVDGAEVVAHLDGRALPFDTGPHALRVELADGRHAEQRVVLHEGEKRRRVVLVVPALAPARPVVEAPFAAPTSAASSGPPNERPRTARRTWPLWIAGGTAAAALGAFAWLGVAGKEKESAMLASCAPRCSADDVHAMRRDYLAADVALGVAVLAIGATVWLHVAGADVEATPVPVRSGAGIALGSRF